MTTWMTAAEVAEHLRISRGTVYEWTNHHGMPVHYLGGTNRYDMAEIDKWVRGFRYRQTLSRHGMTA